ncbi:hypothetical protein [Moraxella lacunata]|uniref:hypothetical protein n=1 Tax=Moraxella lacunata TaxID=477 RepID=UPI003EE1395D
MLLYCFYCLSFYLIHQIVGNDHHDDHRWKAVFNPVSDRRSHQRAKYQSQFTHSCHQITADLCFSQLSDG